MPKRNCDRVWMHDGREEDDDRWEEPAAGHGSTTELCIFLCDDTDGRILAVRAQRGMSASIGVSIAVSHVACPSSALTYDPNFFHMTSTTVLPYIVVSGSNRGNRVCSMHSLDQPWDTMAMHMQRWGAGYTHNSLFVCDARHKVYHMGWRESDPGIRLSEVGPCISGTLPLHICLQNGNQFGC